MSQILVYGGPLVVPNDSDQVGKLKALTHVLSFNFGQFQRRHPVPLCRDRKLNLSSRYGEALLQPRLRREACFLFQINSCDTATAAGIWYKVWVYSSFLADVEELHTVLLFSLIARLYLHLGKTKKVLLETEYYSRQAQWAKTRDPESPSEIFVIKPRVGTI